ncbi:hypothetical protein DFH08DRAFT_822752 [Mycena albidolilacea]|uniref:Uncharacterized protein n=1 Tax=Mycena albidolilacea TaxID=1033008 RepID=A0AAD6Z7N8_9AGAR|nr:hypothetical protein DFH08DRAFT_822752 [Mycena albidolilacea]
MTMRDAMDDEGNEGESESDDESESESVIESESESLNLWLNRCENTRWDRGLYWSDVGVLESRWGASTRQCEHAEWKLNNGIATARIDGRFSTFPGSARERSWGHAGRIAEITSAFYRTSEWSECGLQLQARESGGDLDGGKYPEEAECPETHFLEHKRSERLRASSSQKQSNSDYLIWLAPSVFCCAVASMFNTSSMTSLQLPMRWGCHNRPQSRTDLGGRLRHHCPFLEVKYWMWCEEHGDQADLRRWPERNRTIHLHYRAPNRRMALPAVQVKQNPPGDVQEIWFETIYLGFKVDAHRRLICFGVEWPAGVELDAELRRACKPKCGGNKSGKKRTGDLVISGRIAEGTRILREKERQLGWAGAVARSISNFDEKVLCGTLSNRICSMTRNA